ncbi:MAG: sensor histidine kinase [Solirubrobacteraceae bacterium]
MLKRIPVRWRLTLAFALVMAVVLGATGIFIRDRLASNLNQATNRALRSRAADVAALAQQSDSGLRDAHALVPSQGVELAQLINPSGRVIDHTSGISARPLLARSTRASVRAGHPILIERSRSGRAPIRLLAEPVRAQGETLIVVVGQSLENRDRALTGLTGVLTVGGPAALALASIAGFLLTGAALRPVEAMRRRAAAISATNLAERLSSAGGSDELGRLARTLNEMLARIDRSVTRERTFVSDASHELRNPLAMLRTELELVARERPTGTALQSAVGSAIEETDRLSRLAEDLLMLSRADDGKLTLRLRSVSAAELLSQAAARARRSPASTGVGIVVQALDGLGVLADRDLASRAIDNLLANALRYARTQVQLVACAPGEFAELHVIDDGEGFPADFIPRAWDRFARADAGRTEGGAGLGLAIVARITHAHGGRAQLSNRVGGGADAWIELPRTADRVDGRADQPVRSDAPGAAYGGGSASLARRRTAPAYRATARGEGLPAGSSTTNAGKAGKR